MAKVSVIINCLNGERYLRECLDSVLAQTFTDWEIIFWDNASIDGTRKIAERYDSRLRYFRADCTTDLGMARSQAYQQTSGDYIAILDADDIWFPEKLEKQVSLFLSNSELGLVYCDSVMFDSNGDRFRQFQTCNPKKGWILGDLLAANFIFSSTMMFSRSSLNKLPHVFDENLARAQDYELTLRVSNQFIVDYVDEPLSKWRMSQDNDDWISWKKSLVPRVVEVKQVIENLLDNYPDIKKSYALQLRRCYKELDYNFGMISWENGNVREARDYIKRDLNDKKHAFVYACTFLMSHKLFISLKRVYQNMVLTR